MTVDLSAALERVKSTRRIDRIARRPSVGIVCYDEEEWTAVREAAGLSGFMIPTLSWDKNHSAIWLSDNYILTISSNYDTERHFGDEVFYAKDLVVENVFEACSEDELTNFLGGVIA